MNVSAYLAAAFAIVVWGMTFANTRMLLEDFLALEIQLLRFFLAWEVLWVWEICRRARWKRNRIAVVVGRPPNHAEPLYASRSERCGRQSAFILRR